MIKPEHREKAQIIYAGLPWMEDGSDLDSIACWDYLAKHLAKIEADSIEKCAAVADAKLLVPKTGYAYVGNAIRKLGG